MGRIINSEQIGRGYSAFPCPECASPDSHVIDSRNEPRNARRRRFECNRCGHRYSTYEVSAVEYEHMRTLKINITEFESVIAQLRAIRVQLGDSNGHCKK